jgi:uncharacterized damage-inducible protein DinB
MEDYLIKAFSQSIHGDFIGPDPMAVIADVDYELAGQTVGNLPNSIYQILHHLNAWARWGLNGVVGNPFIRTEAEEELNFFPADESPTSEQWETEVANYRSFVTDFEAALKEVDLTSNHRDWRSFNNARALMFVMGHVHYHTAQIVALRRLLGSYQRPHEESEPDLVQD